MEVETKKENTIGIDSVLNSLNEAVNKAKKGKGSFFIISGETGFGKSHVLEYVSDKVKKHEGLISAFVETQQPIGHFKVGNIQPLMPFQRIVEQLLESKNVSAEKKLAMNMAVSFLAALPGIGEIAYLAKEWKRDIKQFKGERTGKKDDENAADKYFEAIKKFAEKYPAVLLLDDMHWADPQSLELLKKFHQNISNMPLLIVISYKPSEVDNKGLPFFNFISEIKKENNAQRIDLEIYSKNEIRDACKKYFNNYKPNDEFEDWILEKSLGIPGTVHEYLDYFREYPPFGPNGELVTNFKGNEYLPASIQSIFTQKLEDLTEEERNILSLCSAEGKQFTAIIVSDLMNTDILTAIKKLRGLQNKTGIIRSIGAKKRYGIKTTVYEFTQGFYKQFFENALEYEEYTAIHGQIASLLKQKYEEAEAAEVKEQIAPYLAAHSAEAGDEKTAQSMLMETAKVAKKFGSMDIMKSAYESYKQYGKPENDEEPDERNLEFLEMMGQAGSQFSGAVPPAAAAGGTVTAEEAELSTDVDYSVFKEKMIETYHKGRYKIVSQKVENYVQKNEVKLSSSRKTLLYLISAKANIEMDDHYAADNDLSTVLELVEKNGDEEMECIALNLYALLRYRENNLQKAVNFLNKAAQISFKSAPELRLLTLTNIAVLTKESDPQMSEKYFEAARKLSQQLDYKDFSSDLFAVYS